MKSSFVYLFGLISLILTGAPSISCAAGSQQNIRSTVDNAITPIMAKYAIPGMAVGVIIGGKSYVFNYGSASVQPRQPVTNNTLFELGSISKTFTATLASWAQLRGDLSLSDKVGKYLPSLRESRFGGVSLLSLGTHTPGGLPLQVPDSIDNDDQLMGYLKQWQPTYAAGTYRTYSNLGIGVLGLITAKSMRKSFSALMEQQLFLALGMTHSYINVPDARMAGYAQGHTTDGAPVRMTPGVLFAEAYGVRATASDVLRFVQANMGLITLDKKLQQAVTQTHAGYFHAGPMTQDLIWEQYPYPVALKTLLQGNSPAMIFDATPVTTIKPTQGLRRDVWINKTGSTDGFGAYVAFVPQKGVGVVILANKSYPIEARVSAAYSIIESVDATDQ